MAEVIDFVETSFGVTSELRVKTYYNGRFHFYMHESHSEDTFCISLTPDQVDLLRDFLGFRDTSGRTFRAVEGDVLDEEVFTKSGLVANGNICGNE